MNEQQQHLVELVNQQKRLSSDLNTLSVKLNETRDTLLKVQGAIEYLTQVGVKLPEPEPTEQQYQENEESESED